MLVCPSTVSLFVCCFYIQLFHSIVDLVSHTDCAADVMVNIHVRGCESKGNDTMFIASKFLFLRILFFFHFLFKLDTFISSGFHTPDPFLDVQFSFTFMLETYSLVANWLRL